MIPFWSFDLRDFILNTFDPLASRMGRAEIFQAPRKALLLQYDNLFENGHPRRDKPFTPYLIERFIYPLLHLASYGYLGEH